MKNIDIPVSKPSLPKLEDLAEYLRIIDKNRIYTNNGPILHQYELALADFLRIDPKRIVLTANATIALEACVHISKPSEWIVPDFTFSATASAVLRAGKKVKIADVDIVDWSLDCNSKGFKDINKNTVGIMPVAPFGAPIEFEKWSDFKNVIIDGAASLGNPAPNFKVMQKGWFVVYSLHATKIFPAAEGGLIITQNEDAANLLKKWINFGFNEDRISDVLGSNGKMSEYHAAVGLASLKKNVEETRDWLNSLNFIKNVNKHTSLVTQMSGVRPYWIVQFPNAQSKLECSTSLSANGIQSRSWWKSPLSEMPAFKNIPLISSSQVSKHLSRTTLGLPMFRGITTEQLQRITDII